MSHFYFPLNTTVLVLLLLTLSTTLADTSLDEPFSSSFSKLSHAPCVTLFTRNGRMGCGTQDRSNQVGQLQYFANNNIHDKPYVAVLEDYELTAQNIQTLYDARKNYGLLQGVLVLNSTSADGQKNNGDSYTYRSPDSQTPQGYGTPSASLNYGYYQYPWNSKGEGLFQYDLYGIPMALVVESDVSDSLREASQSAAKDDAIVANFNYYMGLDGIDSSQCLAWKDAATGEWSPKCLPLGGTSVWASCGTPVESDRNKNSNNNNNNNRPVVLVAAGIDSTSMFHDVTPGANTAASNILTLIMAAKLIGANVNDNTLDSLPNRIVLAFFQGETYGFVGSRSFLRDVAYPGFTCKSKYVRSSSSSDHSQTSACINPARPDVAFERLGQIAGMISVDQVGHEVGKGILYVHADQNNDNFGSFVAQTLMSCGTNDVSVAAASVNNNNGYPYPPTPLTSLLQLSGGSIGGAVLTGYDYAFTNKVPYHSHLDSASLKAVTLDSIAAAATIMARGAVAAAYDSGDYDSDTAAAYASNLIPELSADDETLVELADCVFSNGDCDLIQKYSSVEMANERARTGIQLNAASPLGTPPNYYVGVYNGGYGQPFVQVGDNMYGAYDGYDYGKKKTDAVGMIPGQLESTLHGMLNDFLSRGKQQSEDELQKCNKLTDCEVAEHCTATCTGGGYCVCQRAHYHVALDEALVPAVNKTLGYFEIDESNDAGISPIYTEPFWSPDVAVKVYRDVGWLPGFFTLVAGLATGAISLFSAFVLKVGLKKEKLY